MEAPGPVPQSTSEAILTTPALSKSRYLAGRQCPKRLWLTVHCPEDASAVAGSQRSIMEMGTAVGRAARALFPGGVLIDETSKHHRAAVAQTQSLIADESTPALFEAAFEHGGVRIRVDVLERLGPGRFGLREVKASSRVKGVHPSDLAIQLWVLRGAGLEVSSAELVHINSKYVHTTPEIDWPQYFVRSDLSAAVEATLGGVSSEVLAMRLLLEQSEPPAVEPGGHCRKPFSCEFWRHCTATKSAQWLVDKKGVKAELKARWREAARSGRPWISPGLASKLARAEPPVWYLDFEALGPAIPLYPDTRPFETLVFQWSLHRVDADGQVSHLEFLAKGDTDPRLETAESLLAAVSRDHARIVVYSNYEARTLRQMAGQNPNRARELEQLGARLFDLLPVVRRYVYYPAFAGSFSIKTVAPTLAPHVRYDDLGDVAEGTAAAAAFGRIAAGLVDDGEERRLRKALLSYCERDTLALMGVHQALRGLVGLA